MEQAVQGALKDTFLLAEVRMARWKRTYLVAVRLVPQGERLGCSKDSKLANPAVADQAVDQVLYCSLWRF